MPPTKTDHYAHRNQHAGLAQLERLPETIKQKRAIGARYQELLAGTPGLILPPAELNGESNIYW